MPQPTGLAIFDGIEDAVNAAFGEAITLTRAGEAAVEIEGVFDARHFVSEVPGEVPVSDYQIFVTVRRDAAGEVAEGDRVEARGTLYRVNDVRPDSEGVVVLALGKLDDAE